MFPGATADREAADYAVVGAPLDRSTTGAPGTRFGPRRIRAAARSFEDYDHHTGRRFTDLGVYDHGDVGPRGEAAEYLSYLESLLGEFADAGIVPAVVGGEHTVSLGGVRALDPDAFVCLDAHLDLRESYAGNPLSHAVVTHRALETADRAVVIGARAGSESEWERAADADVTVLEPAEVSAWDPAPTLDGEGVYLSLDIDAADPGYAPGTGTPEPFGLDPATLRELVRAIAPRAVGFDVVEVNDRDDGQAAVLAAKLLRAFVFAHAAD